MAGLPTVIAVCPPADGATNFARDDALREYARSSGSEVIRLYTWSRPVVSFGRNERTAGRFDPARTHSAGLEAVRRPTGGRALVHDRELTYAVAGHAAADDTLRGTYERWSAILVAGLNAMGVPASIAAPRPRTTTDDGVCFTVPSAGEIVVRGAKLVASAQWRADGVFLQHGSILIDDDQPRVAQALAVGETMPLLPAPATLRGLLGRAPGLTELAEALSTALAAAGAGPVSTVDPATIMSDAWVTERAGHYRDDAWTWRR